MKQQASISFPEKGKKKTFFFLVIENNIVLVPESLTKLELDCTPLRLQSTPSANMPQTWHCLLPPQYSGIVIWIDFSVPTTGSCLKRDLSPILFSFRSVAQIRMSCLRTNARSAPFTDSSGETQEIVVSNRNKSEPHTSKVCYVIHMGFAVDKLMVNRNFGLGTEWDISPAWPEPSSSSIEIEKTGKM